MTRTEILAKVSQSPEERLLLSRVWDKLEGARRGVPGHTPFLSTAQQEAALRLITAAGHPSSPAAGPTPSGSSAPSSPTGRRRSCGRAPWPPSTAPGSRGRACPTGTF